MCRIQPIFLKLQYREQVEIAINEADSILFVVDVRTGVNPLDIEMAQILRSSK